MLDIETIILQYLIHNKEFFEVVIPYLDEKLFESVPHKHICRIIKKYFIEEERAIPYDLLGVKILNLEKINVETVKAIQTLYGKLTTPNNSDVHGIIKEAEKYFKQRKIWNVISNGIEEYDNSKDFSTEFISQAEEAIGYSFDDNVGYNYMKNFHERFELYKANVVKIPMSISMMNEMTDGGVEKKTINAAISSTGGGKSVWLCQEAAYHLENGRNVLYITLEMSEVQISKRIDANLLNYEQDKLKNVSAEKQKLFYSQLKQKSMGELIIKEFPASSITSLDIKRVIDQIKRKNKIDIDVLIVDYLGLMESYRYSTKMNNSYVIGKHAAEELRSLAVQYNIPVWTAIQFNRGAENPEEAKKLGLGQVSDSYGIPMGLDFLFAIIHTDELAKEKKSIFKILKNRYGEKKNTAGIFTVLQNFACSKFMDDPKCIEIQYKDDSGTDAAKQIDKKLKNNDKSSIIEKTDNILGQGKDDLFL